MYKALRQNNYIQQLSSSVLFVGGISYCNSTVLISINNRKGSTTYRLGSFMEKDYLRISSTVLVSLLLGLLWFW